MKKTPITHTHLQIMQEIVDFLQSRGWAVDRLRIYRYDDSEEPFGPAKESWKADRWKWALDISTSPQDEEEVHAKLKHHTNLPVMG